MNKKLEKWDYFKEENLKRNWENICITCYHFHHNTTDTFATILNYPIHEKLISRSYHLIRNCKYLLKNKTIFGSEAS